MNNYSNLIFSLIKKKVRAPFVGPKSKKFPDGLKVSKKLFNTKSKVQYEWNTWGRVDVSYIQKYIQFYHT